MIYLKKFELLDNEECSGYPFLLSIPNAKIYDLDSIPVMLKNWYELENMRIYYKCQIIFSIYSQ